MWPVVKKRNAIVLPPKKLLTLQLVLAFFFSSCWFVANFLDEKILTCHDKYAEKSVKTMTSDHKKICWKIIEKWINTSFYGSPVTKNVVRFKNWSLFVTKNSKFVFCFYFFLKWLNECVSDVKYHEIDLMRHKILSSPNNWPQISQNCISL